MNDYHRNTPDQELLDDLKSVAKKINKNTVTISEYEENGKFHPSTLQRKFGSWFKILELANLAESRSKLNIPAEGLYENIEQVWISLGRQPKCNEVKKPLSKYSSGTDDKRFGSFRKALEAFVEFINSDNDQNQEILKPESEESSSEIIEETGIIFKHKTKRTPSERLKVQVLMRDGNKCRLCGITVTGENIHFDHILAWSKGGETVLENLQVLCAVHNLAKGNMEHEAK